MLTGSGWPCVDEAWLAMLCEDIFKSGKRIFTGCGACSESQSMFKCCQDGRHCFQWPLELFQNLSGWRDKVEWLNNGYTLQ